MALSAKDQAAVAAAAKAGGLTGVSVNANTGTVTAANSKASTPAPAPVVSAPSITKTSSSGVTTPLATMGTTASDPAKNVSAPSTSIPASQSNNIASGISIGSNGQMVTAANTPSSNANTANLLMSSYPGASTSSGGGATSSYTGGSVVDYLSSVGKPSDFNSRAALAAQYGIQNYTGTADQNTLLLSKMRGGSGGSTPSSYSTPPVTQPYTPATVTSTPYATPYTASVTTPSSGVTPGTTATSQSTPSPYTSTGTYSAPSNTGLYGQLITQQANRAQTSPEYTQAQAAYQKAISDYNALKQSMDTELANIDLNPGTLHFQQGQKQVLNNMYAQRLADAAAQVTQAQQGMQFATSQYGAQTSALQGAIGAAGTVLSGGQYQPFGGSNASMQAGIANATKWAIAQQNMAQGANYQGQAQELSNALQSMQPLGNKLTSFMTQAGLNPDSAPLLNQQINTIDAQLHPEAVATMNAAISDIRSYAIQILGSQSGANPTDVTQSVSSFDFGNFTPVQLSMLFANLENMGMVRLSQAQAASQAGYNANLTGGGAAAQGMTAQDMGGLQTDKTMSSDTVNNLKLLGGVGATVVGGAAGAANAATNAISGLAAKVLAL